MSNHPPTVALSRLACLFLMCQLGLTAQVTNFSPEPGDSMAASTGSTGSTEAPSKSLEHQSPEQQGDLLMARGDYAAAVSAYQQALPRTAVIWNKLGIAYHHLFALDEALKDYKTALSLDPHYAGAYNNLGAVYHGKKQFSLAEKAYKRALKYQPSAAVTYCNLGTTYFAESKYKKGVKAYQEAMKIDPEVFNPDRKSKIEEGSSREQRMAIAFSLAEVYAGSGNNDAALASLRKALSNGFNDRKRLMEDKELASLRKMPEFQELLAQNQLQ